MHSLAPKKQSGNGDRLEKLVLLHLRQCGYICEPQVIIGQRITGKGHKIDILATKCGATYLVSTKWQQVGGTAEDKVPFETLCLRAAVLSSSGKYKYAYIVLGGPGWSTRNYFISDDFERDLPHRDAVTILNLEEFMALANTGRL